ncbi:hypothetical protein Salat_2817800 [Sesamum alatum]|uniref:CCHC-type domain-containing protein n=1 Tax=Sesamum alatum TaxID=300844 RepID=A0AAE2C9U0_9LAMI|nr:hypothetical protein Salat_2817800 [Sesamum alatum]
MNDREISESAQLDHHHMITDEKQAKDETTAAESEQKNDGPCKNGRGWFIDVFSTAMVSWLRTGSSALHLMGYSVGRPALIGIPNDTKPELTKLQWCDFTVHVHNLPQERWLKSMAEFIGNKLGRYRVMDWYKEEPSSFAGFKIRVGLNISNSLRRFMKIWSPDGDDYIIHFTYARLLNFCYLCGLIGHISKDCDIHYTDGFVDPGSDTPFEPWLRQIGTVRGGQVFPTHGSCGRMFPTIMRQTPSACKDVENDMRGSRILGDFVHKYNTEEKCKKDADKGIEDGKVSAVIDIKKEKMDLPNK